MKNRKGFTLIQLLIAISIAALIAFLTIVGLVILVYDRVTDYPAEHVEITGTLTH